MGLLEDYLEGKPLSERLRRLGAGEEEDPVPEEPVQAGHPTDLRPLDNEDRKHLRRLKFDPGWAILLRMLDRWIQKMEDSAKAASKAKPTAKDENAAMWAEVASLEQTRKQLVGMIDGEIALIQEDEKRVPAAKRAAKKRTR